jgi:hypothetical protein
MVAATICGSKKAGGKGVHVVSARVGENNPTLGELATGEKSKGNVRQRSWRVATITAVPELPDVPDIKGDVVTADAGQSDGDRE